MSEQTEQANEQAAKQAIRRKPYMAPELVALRGGNSGGNVLSRSFGRYIP